MVLHAARRRRHLLQAPQSRRRFTRVQHLAPRAFQGAHEPVSERRHGRQPLHEIQRRPFARQQRPRRAVRARQVLAGPHPLAARLAHLHGHAAALQLVDQLQQFHAGHHHRLLRVERARRLALRRHEQIRRQVARADIFFERPPYCFADFWMRDVEHDQRLSFQLASSPRPASCGTGSPARRYFRPASVVPGRSNFLPAATTGFQPASPSAARLRSICVS